MRHAGLGGIWLAAVLAATVLVGCNAHPPPTGSPLAGGPGGSPRSTPSHRPATPSPVPTPEPTPIRYRIRTGDSLAGIARRYNVTIDRILRANRSIRDPNQITAGQVIVIPPKGAPVRSQANYDAIDDDENDVVDENGKFTDAPGYGDIYSFEARATGTELILTITVLGVPPRISPDSEQVTYRVVIDGTADDIPEWIIRYGNGVTPGAGYAVSFEDRERGRVRTGRRFPGVDESLGSTIRFRIPLSVLRDPALLRVAARAERVFQPGTAGAVKTIDDAPRPQWPDRAAQWLEVEVD